MFTQAQVRDLRMEPRSMTFGIVGRVFANARGHHSLRAAQAIPYGIAVFAVTAAAAIAARAESLVSLPAISLILLAPVLIIALTYGFGPSLLAAILATLAYDLIFASSYYSLDSGPPGHLAAAMLFAVAALATGRLAARARARSIEARADAQRNAALFQFARQIARRAAAPRRYPRRRGCSFR